jgi:hypothetical protein
MHWGGHEGDRLREEQVRLHRAQLRRLTDEELLHSYELFLQSLQLEEDKPPSAAMVRYFEEYWRELRRRLR